MSDHHTPTRKRRPTIAKDWQLAVLKKLQAESENPTEEQRLAAAAETGLDEKWVRNWFARRRSRLAARQRSRRQQLSSTEPYCPTVQTFKVQLHNPPQFASTSDPLQAFVPIPADHAPHLSTESPKPSPVSRTLHSPRPLRLIVDTQPLHQGLSSPSQNPTLVPHTTPIPAYSRDPLYNRYPDFSQFFHPQVHQRFCTVQLSAEVKDDDPHVQSLADANIDLHAGSLLAPFYLDGLCIHHRFSTPVAFSMRLVDLLSHFSPTHLPTFSQGV